jgi:Domain of unknown function (DUF4234)
MAEEIQIPGTQAKAKIRSPWAPALLPFVTLGIYYFFWYYYINREMADLGRAKNTDELGDSPGKSLLAVTLGWLIIVPAVLSIIHTAQRIQTAQRLSGVELQLNGWLAVVMALLLPPVFYGYQQSELNKVWRAVGGGEPAAVEAAAPPAPVEQAPAPAPTPEEAPPTA